MPRIKQRIEHTNHELIKIQDEIRDFFGWNLSDDLHSTEKLLYKVDNSNVNSWKISNREKNLFDIIERMNSTDKKIVPNFLIEKNDNLENIKDLLNGLKLVGDFMYKTILKPNNVNYPISRNQFINSLR